jgi:two-component system chemotaxis response regulator CheY
VRPILLVDGDPDARTILRRMLEFHGFEAVEATEHDEALARARRGDLGLVMTEMYVQAGDGVGCLVESLKADASLADLPVVVVTTQAFAATEQRARAAGSAAYILKPFRATDVIAEVVRFVEP